MSSATAPVIILTGASRGIGLAIAHYLLSPPHSVNLVAVARTAPNLQSLQSQYPEQVTPVAGDLTHFSTAKAAVETAISKFGRIDAVIVNHGALGPVDKLENADPEQWRKLFDVNFFSAVVLVKEAIGELRKSRGRVVFVSSGAAVTGYQAWGAYGASKAAMNHLSLTLAEEEPEITSISIRPGVIDTQMQQEIREHHGPAMGSNHGKFMQLKETGNLLRPEQPGHVIAKLALFADKTLSGRFLSWNAPELKEFQEVEEK
ncbi:hypothetical protein RUND412_000322 [Rhizina undulata]